jgi:hypothetical protein
MTRPVTSSPSETRARQIFKQAGKECQEVIKHVLHEERGVMHLLKRNEIHTKIYDIIKRVAR